MRKMSKFGKQLIESMEHAAKHAEGLKVRGIRETTVEVRDGKAIGKKRRSSASQSPAATFSQSGGDRRR